MPSQFYRAAVSRTPNRESLSIIFRHPGRVDAAGRTGLRVRRGLGTRNTTEANSLVEEMNEILQTPALWPASARLVAERRFDARVVAAFYDDLVPDAVDFFGMREEVLPLPGHDEGYRTLLLVGPIGGGKTTMTRQVLGTHPENERFPSTSIARTTVADLEFILAPGTFAAAVTFMPMDEVREYLEDCMSAAGVAADEGADDRTVQRRLLNHVDQRVRFSYVLGQGVRGTDEDTGEERNDEPAPLLLDGAQLDKTATAEVIHNAVATVRRIAARAAEAIRGHLGPVDTDVDQRALTELVEEELDRAVRNDAEFDELAKSLMEEIAKRFSAVENVGTLHKNRQGWPRLWQWSCPDRSQFIRVVNRFTSNYAPLFGELLTPLVNGIRVQGPFKPAWCGEEIPRLVICDGEGLGHTPESATSLPTSMSRRIEQVDTVLLVDNAEQAMQAAPVAVLRQMATSGHTNKLVVCFTHFGEGEVDNLPTLQSRRDHVFASVESVLTSIGKDIGAGVERALRRTLESRCFYVGGINQIVTNTNRLGRYTLQQLGSLLETTRNPTEGPEIGEARPEYDMSNMMFGIQRAATRFHEEWKTRLGLLMKPGAKAEHWTRIKALSRRLAMQRSDQYDTLRPLADLYRELTEAIRRFIEKPLRWSPDEPVDEVQSAIFDGVADGTSRRVRELIGWSLYSDRVTDWGTAYGYVGGGSGRRRSLKISHDIFEKGAPIPGEDPSVDVTVFLKAIRAAFKEVADELGITTQ